MRGLTKLGIIALTSNLSIYFLKTFRAHFPVKDVSKKMIFKPIMASEDHLASKLANLKLQAFVSDI